MGKWQISDSNGRFLLGGLLKWGDIQVLDDFPSSLGDPLEWMLEHFMENPNKTWRMTGGYSNFKKPPFE